MNRDPFPGRTRMIEDAPNSKNTSKQVLVSIGAAALVVFGLAALYTAGHERENNQMSPEAVQYLEDKEYCTEAAESGGIFFSTCMDIQNMQRQWEEDQKQDVQNQIREYEGQS